MAVVVSGMGTSRCEITPAELWLGGVFFSFRAKNRVDNPESVLTPSFLHVGEMFFPQGNSHILRMLVYCCSGNVPAEGVLVIHPLDVLIVTWSR